MFGTQEPPVQSYEMVMVWMFGDVEGYLNVFFNVIVVVLLPHCQFSEVRIYLCIMYALDSERGKSLRMNRTSW